MLLVILEKNKVSTFLSRTFCFVPKVLSPQGNHHNKFWRKSGVPLVELYFGQPYKNTNKRMTQCFGGILYDLTIMQLMSDTFQWVLLFSLKGKCVVKTQGIENLKPKVKFLRNPLSKCTPNKVLEVRTKQMSQTLAVTSANE